MSAVGIAIMTTAISISATTKNPVVGTKVDALKAIGKATFVQYNFDKKLGKLEKKYITDDIKLYGGILSIAIRVATEKRISYEWTF